jgi:hypothetical protein
MDGMTAWVDSTNLVPQALVVSSNSPGAGTVAGALDALRRSQPGGSFMSIGQVLAAPELSVSSPWLSMAYFTGYPLAVPPPDADIEALATQLLALLRPDSVAAVNQGAAGICVQFSGVDDYTYGVQVSTDLVNWTTVSTNAPTNGVFNYLENPGLATPARFFRSVVLP